MSAADSFAAAIEKIEHADRLKEALRSMLSGASLPKAHAHGLLEGQESPEDRIVLATELAKSIKAEDSHALFLWANNKELGLKGLKAVADLLTPPTRTPKITNHLSFIDLSDNALTNYGVEFTDLRNLIFQLGKLHSLRFFSLHSTTLGFQGASIVAKLLRVSKTLRHLDLSRCQIGDRGAQALYAAFVPDDDFVEEDLAEEERGGALPGGSTEANTARRASQLAASAGLGDAAAAAAAAASGEGGDGSGSASVRRASVTGSAADEKGVNPLADPRLAAIHALNPAKPAAAAAAAAPAEGGAGAGGASTSRPPSAGGSGALKRPGSASAGGVRPGSATSRRAQAALGLGIGRANVESSNTTLTHLDLSSNGLAGFDNPMPACKLVRALAEHPSLVWLNLSRNRFTRSINTQLIAGLESNRGLRTLIMEANNLDAAPATRLAEMIATHPALEVLNLRFNSVRSDGAIAFANVLAASTQPYAMAVADQIVASSSSAATAKVDADGIAIDESADLKAPGSSRTGGFLRSIDLRQNYIGPIGTRAVLEALGVVFPPSMPAEGAAGGSGGTSAALAAAEAARHEEEKAAAAAAEAQKRGRPGSASKDDHHHDEPDSEAGAGVILAGSGSRALLALKKQQRKAALRALGLGVTGTIAEEDEGAAEEEGEEEEEEEEAGSSTTAAAANHETKITTSVSVTSEGDIVQLVQVTVTIHPPQAAAAAAASAPKQPHPHQSPAKPKVVTKSFSRVVRMDGEVVSKLMADRLAHLEMDAAASAASSTAATA